MQTSLFLLFTFCFSVVFCSSCVPDPFGPASPYNLFSLSQVSACNSDVEGRVAANGPVDLTSYSIGLKLPESLDYSLISSSAINWSMGSCWHGGITGSSVNAANVAIMISGNTITASDCCSDSGCSGCNPGATETSPLDFLEAESYLYQTSLYWSSLGSTEGSSANIQFQTLTLTCAPGVQFNSFSGVSISGVTSIVIDCDATQTVLINYTPETLSFSNLGVSFPNSGDESKVIHHFTGDSLTLTGVGVPGSVFAPWSQVSLTGGIVYGQVIVGSFVRSSSQNLMSETNPNLSSPPNCNDGQINHVPFTGCAPIPQPTFLCCTYTQGNIVNSFCSTEEECFNFGEGWAVDQSNVEDCSSCCVC